MTHAEKDKIIQKTLEKCTALLGSVFDMVHSGEDYIEELWDEKICDSINYLLLLRVAAEEFEL